MICSKCGAYNPDYYVFCQNCFADLSEFGVPDGSELPLKPKPLFKDEPASQADNLEQTIPLAENQPPTTFEGTGSAEIFIRDAPDEPAPKPDATVQQKQKNPTPPPKKAEPKPQPKEERQPAQPNKKEPKISQRELRRQQKKAEHEVREIQKLQANQGAEYYDYYDYYDEAALKRERRRSRVVGLIFWLVLLAVVVVALLVGAWFLIDSYGSVMGGIQILLGGQVPVSVEAYVDDDGVAGHKITVSGKENDELHFRDAEVNQRFQLVNNQPVSYKIPDNFWIPNDPDPAQATLEIKPDVVLIDPNGNETKLEVPSYTIDVPTTTLSVTEPVATDNIETESAAITITGQAATETGENVQVFVYGFQLGDSDIDSAGNFTCQAAVNPGPFNIDVVAKAPKHRSTTVTLTGVAGGGSFSITEDLTKSVSEETVRITGTAPIGGTLTVTGTSGDIQYDSNTGSFSFVARLPDYGPHEFTLTVGASSETVSVRRVPEVQQYTSSATQLVYADVLANPNDNAGKVFVFDASVTEIVSESPIIVMNVTVFGNADQKLEINYFGVVKPKAGDKYRVYASANGTNEDKSAIRMNAYFIYTDEELARAG